MKLNSVYLYKYYVLLLDLGISRWVIEDYGTVLCVISCANIICMKLDYLH